MKKKKGVKTEEVRGLRIKYGTIFSFKVPRVVLPQIRQRSVAPLPSLDRNEAHTESLPSLAAPGYLIQTCDRRARGTRGPVASRPLLLRRLCLLVILALSLCHRKVSRDTHRSRDLANNTSSCGRNPRTLRTRVIRCPVFSVRFFLSLIHI